MLFNQAMSTCYTKPRFGRTSSVRDNLDSSECPEDYQYHPLILVSLDGFRPDYLDRDLTPTLKSLYDIGVSAPYMKPSFPTLTFPNHYSIVTVSMVQY